MQFTEKVSEIYNVNFTFLWWLIGTSSLLNIVILLGECREWHWKCYSVAQIDCFSHRSYQFDTKLLEFAKCPSNILRIHAGVCNQYMAKHIVRSPNVDNFWFKWLSSFKMFTVCLAGDVQKRWPMNWVATFYLFMHFSLSFDGFQV